MMAADDDRPSSDDEMVKTKAYVNMQESRRPGRAGATVDGQATHRSSEVQEA